MMKLFHYPKNRRSVRLPPAPVFADVVYGLRFFSGRVIINTKQNSGLR
jgi:hypothetical protein